MKAKKKIGFMTKVLIGLLLGVVAGIVFGEKMSTVGFIGTIFLRLLRVGVVPLILCNIVIAVAGIGDLKKLGRIGIKMFILFMATTLVAAVIGLVFGLIVNPGLGYTMTEVGEVTGSRLLLPSRASFSASSAPTSSAPWPTPRCCLSSLSPSSPA